MSIHTSTASLTVPFWGGYKHKGHTDNSDTYLLEALVASQLPQQHQRLHAQLPGKNAHQSCVHSAPKKEERPQAKHPPKEHHDAMAATARKLFLTPGLDDKGALEAGVAVEQE